MFCACEKYQCEEYSITIANPNIDPITVKILGQTYFDCDPIDPLNVCKIVTTTKIKTIEAGRYRAGTYQTFDLVYDDCIGFVRAELR